MERLKELITQLKEQFDHKAEPAQLLEITRLLEAEIRLMASQPPAPARVMPTKIAVMMPSSTKIVVGETQHHTVQPVASAVPPVVAAPPAPAPASNAVNSGSGYPVSNAAPSANASLSANAAPSAMPTGSASPAVAQSNGMAVSQSNGMATANIVAPTAVVNGTVTVKAGPERGQWPFDPLAEKPTDRFTLSQKAREVNDVIGTTSASSLNDKLRSDVVDLKSTLNDSPVRDLKKAIGLNDRYLFINQLFRGDEVMYERSLKTINGFRILPEAEYWMERELKVKLGWDENRETTRHFYQLVKRRFS
ncbi:MAG TPA: hypothetical protein VGN00_18600 [Puia sp.]|jgi:hypothetical protein